MPRPMGTACEASGIAALDLFADRDSDERVADPDVHADELVERRCQARQARSSTGEDDLADTERVGLALVELERGDELSREALERRI